MTQTTDALTGATINEPSGSTSTQTTSTLQEQAGTTAAVGREQAGAVARDAAQHARELLGTTGQELRSHASDQTQRIATTLQDMHQQLQGIGRGEAPSGMVADITNQLATMAGRTAERLQNGGIDGLMYDVKSFARRRPGMFLLGALGAGAVIGRMLRATDTQRLMHAATGQQQGSNGAGTNGTVVPGTGYGESVYGETVYGETVYGESLAGMANDLPTSGISDLSGLGTAEDRVPGYPEGSTAIEEI